MKLLIQLKNNSYFWSLLFVCFALLPRAQAVVPPPDGGYPGFTRRKGKTLFLASPLALGTRQLAGFRSSASPRAASTPLSARGRFFSTPQTQIRLWRCSAFIQHHRHQQHGCWSGRPFKQHHCRGKHGHWRLRASLSNTDGHFNTANGAFALLATPPVNDNTATGDSALFSNTTAPQHSHRYPALGNNTTGSNNTAIGWCAFQYHGQNTAIGANALSSNTTGIVNTATGIKRS